MRLLVIGARVGALLEAAGLPAEEVMFVPGSAARITATVRQILFKIDEWRSEAGVERSIRAPAATLSIVAAEMLSSALNGQHVHRQHGVRAHTGQPDAE
jgi:hypothetical protein